MHGCRGDVNRLFALLNRLKELNRLPAKVCFIVLCDFFLSLFSNNVHYSSMSIIVHTVLQFCNLETGKKLNLGDYFEEHCNAYSTYNLQRARVLFQRAQPRSRNENRAKTTKLRILLSATMRGHILYAIREPYSLHALHSMVARVNPGGS